MDKANSNNTVASSNNNNNNNNNSNISFTKNNESNNAIGGWSRMMIMHDNKKCDIKEVNRLDRDIDSIIYQHFIIDQQPLIIRNCFDIELKDWQASDRWKRHRIIYEYGTNYIHSLGRIPYSELYGGANLNGPFTLQEYISKFLISNHNTVPPENFTIPEPPLYWFKAISPPYDDEISSNIIKIDIKPLKFFSSEKAKKMNYSISEKYYQHFVGAIGSGSSPHLHNNAWNVLLYGKKLWNLWQPGHSFISNIPTLNYVEQNEQVEDQFVKQCVQNRGDIILVPNQWGHSTFSLMENVGIASEFDVHLSL